MSYLDNDTYGMYRRSSSDGPGPRLMGADTLMATTSTMRPTRIWVTLRKSCWT